MIYYIAYYNEVLCGALALICLILRVGLRLNSAIIYVLFCVLIDLLSRYAGIVMPDGNKNNQYYYNLAYPIEIILLGLVFFKEVFPISKVSLIQISVCLLWLVICIANMAWFQGFYVLNTSTFLLGGLISIILSVWVLFTYVNRNPQTSGYYLQPTIWFWSSILVSSAFTFVYRVIEPTTKFNSKKLFIATVVVAAIIKYIGISISFILAYLKKSRLVKKWEITK